MMTNRFLAWVAVRAQEDSLRLSMALFSIFVVIVWGSLGLWPKSAQEVGRRAFLVLGGLSYAILFAVALGVLVWDLYLAR